MTRKRSQVQVLYGPLVPTRENACTDNSLSRLLRLRLRLGFAVAKRSLGGFGELLRLELARFDGRHKLLMVELVLLGVRSGELSHSLVESVTASEVSSDCDWISRTCMSPGEGPPTDLSISPKGIRPHQLKIRRDLPVPQLAH